MAKIQRAFETTLATWADDLKILSTITTPSKVFRTWSGPDENQSLVSLIRATKSCQLPVSCEADLKPPVEQQAEV